MKKILLVLIIAFLLILSSCNNPGASATPTGSSSISPSSVIVTQTPKSSADNVLPSPTQSVIQTPPVNTATANNKLYYGSWVITKAYDAGITALTTDEKKQLIGKLINYSSEAAVFENVELKMPYYNETSMTNDYFVQYYKINLSYFGIASNSVTNVEVCTDAISKKLWNGAASQFFVKDKNTLIMAYKGSYFELDRK